VTLVIAELHKYRNWQWIASLAPQPWITRPVWQLIIKEIAEIRESHEHELETPLVVMTWNQEANFEEESKNGRTPWNQKMNLAKYIILKCVIVYSKQYKNVYHVIVWLQYWTNMAYIVILIFNDIFVIYLNNI
jgi:hypothetical protein